MTVDTPEVKCAVWLDEILDRLGLASDELRARCLAIPDLPPEQQRDARRAVLAELRREQARVGGGN